MISYDLECKNSHRFEGVFKDHRSFKDQLEKKMVSCPICNNQEIKQLFTGCSMQKKSTACSHSPGAPQTFSEAMHIIDHYVKENFENVGKEFADKARAIHYGAEEERNIYGESTVEEISELNEEGISILPLPDVKKLEN
ncbi:MAG: DUF1178 family protein [bacterium]|nr:DUF1178 family protein [bacterium]